MQKAVSYHTFFVTLISVVLMVSNRCSAQYHFEDQSTSLGVQHVYSIPALHGGGLSFCDFNDDGWDDLSFATNNDSIHFYLNNGGTFQRIDLGIGLTGEIKQILWVDQDNDGDKDLYITQFLGQNYLFENDGNLNFTDITSTAGLLTHNAPTFGAAWGDVDNDGFLDLYVTNRVDDFWPFCNYLYLNNGDDTFTNVTWSAGVPDSLKSPFLAVLFDYDRDGHTDIYIPQDKYYGNTLFKNDGTGNFADVSSASFSDLMMEAMSGSVEDIDGNGFADIYITNTPDGNKLLMNQGNGTFNELASQAGVDHGYFSWGANWLDIENDGDLDLHVVGLEVQLPDTQIGFYVQDSPLHFNRPEMSMHYDTARCHGAAVGDVNNDGRLDVAINGEYPSYSKLLINNSISGHWVKLHLQGVVSNRDGVGSIIELWENGNYQARYTLCGESYVSQNSGIEHFGIGVAQSIDSVIIEWPSGVQDKMYDVQVDQTVLVLEGSTTIPTQTDDNKTLGIRIFPNPASDQLFVNIHQLDKYDLQVYSATGQLVSVQFISVDREYAVIDLNDFASGLYVLLLTDRVTGISALQSFAKTID